MALPSVYTTGTVTIANGSTALAGAGTSWITLADIQPGDYFRRAGSTVRVAAVNSNTSITLAEPWPGAALAGSAYEIQRTPDDVRLLNTARSLLEELKNGNLAAIAALVSAADKLPYFNGAGSAALAGFTGGGRALVGLTGANGKLPVFTGASVAAARDIVGTVSQAGGIPTGALVEKGTNANGQYVRFADGTQICCMSPVISLANEAWQVFMYPSAFASTAGIAIYGGFDTAPASGDVNAWLNAVKAVTFHNYTTSHYRAIFRIGGTSLSVSAITGTAFVSAVGRWF